MCLTFSPAGEHIAQVDNAVGGVVLRNVRGFSLPKADPTAQRLRGRGRDAFVAKATFGVVIVQGEAVRFVAFCRHCFAAVGAAAAPQGGDPKAAHAPTGSAGRLEWKIKISID